MYLNVTFGRHQNSNTYNLISIQHQNDSEF